MRRSLRDCATMSSHVQLTPTKHLQFWTWTTKTLAKFSTMQWYFWRRKTSSLPRLHESLLQMLMRTLNQTANRRQLPRLLLQQRLKCCPRCVRVSNRVHTCMPALNALTLRCGDAGCEKGVSRADTAYFGRSQKRKLNRNASKIP